MKKIVIVWLVLAFVSCNEKIEIVQTKQAHQIPDVFLALNNSSIVWHQDSLYWNGAAFSGKAISLFANGDTAIIQCFWEGLQEGSTRKWHPNKQLAEDRYYINGKKEGRHRAWWPNGKQLFDFTVSNDDYQGELKEWNSKGFLVKQFHYTNGQETGSQRLWWDDSTVRANYEIRNGKKYGLIGIKLCKNPYDSVNKN
jgi:hypothetical protein